MRNPKNTKKRIIIHALPHELINEILLRLPVKSLLRFKCVCKSWLSLISDPQFAKSHFDLAAAPFYRPLRRRSCTSLCSIDIDGSLNTAAVYRHPSPPCPPKCFVDKVEILGSCRGFVLLYYEKGYLYLWNSSTASRKQLPGSFSDLTRFYHYGFGYDASTDDYLVFLVRLHKYIEEYKQTSWIQFFSVKTNSWKFMNGVNLPYKDMGCRVGSPFNGALHWLVFSYDKIVPVIIAFDLMERTLSDIPLPHDLTVGSEYDLHGLRVMDRCLSVLCTIQNSAGNETWVMKEYKLCSHFGLYPTGFPQEGFCQHSFTHHTLPKMVEFWEQLFVEA